MKKLQYTIAFQEGLSLLNSLKEILQNSSHLAPHPTLFMTKSLNKPTRYLLICSD